MPAFDEEKQIRKLVEMYRRGFDDVLKTIVSKEAKGLWTAYHRKLLLAIQAILIQLDEDAQQWIDETIGQVYAQATAETAAFLLGLGIAQDASKFAQLHQRAIDVLVQNMTDNLRDASQFVGRRVDDIFRKIAVEQAGAKYASGTTIDEMKKQVLKELLDNGQTAFIDKAGRKWRLDTYTEMVSRTTTREAASVATINTCKEFGVDLVKISTHYPTCERCAALQGKVFCISGEDKRYPQLKDEYRPPLHPHCRHVINPYIRELDDDADAVQEHSNTSLTDDPRSDEEKQAYKEIRDQVTIATNRRRAREVLYNKSAPAEEKVKAARVLKKSYEKTGTKAVGKDGVFVREYDEYLKTSRYQGKLILKGNRYSPEYRSKLLDLDEYFSKHGHMLSEHALNNVLGRTSQKRLNDKESVLELLNSPIRYIQPDGNLVKYLNGMSAHINQETGIVITISPRKKPGEDWEVVGDD